MLKYLQIENIAVIEKTEIELSQGFTVLTGETGAGKSIIIDALNAVLGERTSKELIRSGCDKAEVSAVFSNLNGDAIELLEQNGYLLDDGGELLVRRTLNAAGNGSVRINGKPATVGVLKEIGRGLVDIHGQHDNQNLLDEQMHCGYIDRLASNSVLREEYYCEFKKLNSIRREISALETDDDEKQRRTELLSFQITELENAAICVGEIEKLKTKLSIAENFEKTVRALQTTLSYIKGDENSDGAKTMLASAKRELMSVEQFANDSEKLEGIIYELEAVCENIHSFTENNFYSADETAQIRERLDLLYRLMLKYGDSEEKMLVYLTQAQSELDKINFSDQRIDELSSELEISTEKLIKLGEKLTKSRITAAKHFEKQVCDGLKQLNMPNVVFTVDFTKGKYTKNGCDEVKFLISANAGEEPRPLAKIASGGELSRIMLVIKQALADADSVETLIFDEIDTGISGNAAVKVGRMMRNVSENRQVLCVTHLAQIAAASDNHLLIEKHTDNGKTFTNVKPLSCEQQISEIARIMAGGTLTENILNSAKELLDRSKTDENL